MQQGVLSILSIFLLSLSLAGPILAETTHGDTPHEDSEYVGRWIEGCQSYCKEQAGPDGERLASYFQKNCTTAFEKEQLRDQEFSMASDIFQRATTQTPKCLGVAAKKAFWDFPVAIGAAIWDQIAKARQSAKKQEEFRLQCSQSIECRRSLARNFVRYYAHDKQGHYQIPNEQVDREIKDLSFNTIYRKAFSDLQRMKSECRRLHLRVVRNTYPIYPNKSSLEVYDLVYKKIESENRHCISILQLVPAKDLPPINKKSLAELASISANYLQKKTKELYGGIENWFARTAQGFRDLPTAIATARICLAPEDFNNFIVDICSDIVPTPGIAVKQISRKFSALLGKKPHRPLPKAVSKSKAFFSHPGHKKLVDDYASIVYVSEAKNQAFINLAKKGSHPKFRYFDAENAALKELNTITDDKELVTALTNYHKKALLSEIDTLKEKYPGFQFHAYSDFKSIKIAIEAPKAFDKTVNDQLRTDINEAFRRANARFSDKMKASKVEVEKLGPQDTWFRGGFGENVDEASLAARKARQFKDQVGVLDYNTRRVKGELESKLALIDEARISLSHSKKLRSLMTKEANGQWIPREDAFELVRKNKSPQSLAQAMTDKYGKPFSEEEARALLNYAYGVDEFSPTILVAKRELPSLDSPEGGLSADFLGMGAANLQATAKALANSKRDLDQAVRLSRVGEQNVTKTFTKRKEAFQKLAEGNVVCTGDDCVKALEKPLSYREKEVLLNRIASHPDTRRVRMSFVGPGVDKAHQMVIATHGEAIEKELRKRLTGKLSEAKLNRLTFGLDMNTRVVGEGEVQLIIGRQKGLRLTHREHDLIQREFVESVQEGHYQAGGSSVLFRKILIIPGPPPEFLPDEESGSQ
ncbi:MAG: hypothetical protein KDD33_05930 [Bdellovibrionales bacterium]|nr:hypothetical protein [Bdellovibrionales bacterium]